MFHKSVSLKFSPFTKSETLLCMGWNEETAPTTQAGILYIVSWTQIFNALPFRVKTPSVIDCSLLLLILSCITVYNNNHAWVVLTLEN